MNAEYWLDSKQLEQVLLAAIFAYMDSYPKDQKLKQAIRDIATEANFDSILTILGD